jgi:hypothetical protein
MGVRAWITVGLAIAASACSSASSGGNPGPAGPLAVPSAWSTFHNAGAGLDFSLRFPATWHASHHVEPNSMSHTTFGFLTYEAKGTPTKLLEHPCPMTPLLGPDGLLISVGAYTSELPGGHSALPSGPSNLSVAGHRAWVRTFHNSACNNQLELEASIEISPDKIINLYGVTHSTTEVSAFRSVVGSVRT